VSDRTRQSSKDGPDTASESDDESGNGDARGRATSPELEAEREAEQALTQELDSLQSEFEVLNDRHLRLAAEFQNFRRRAEGEMTEAWGRAQADLVRRLVDVLDDLQRVAELDPAHDAVSVESIVEGIDLVERNFVRALTDAGVEIVHPAGERFDPETMEAMMRVPVDSADEDDLVQHVFQDGYLMKGHLIRPARVSVKKHE